MTVEESLQAAKEQPSWKTTQRPKHIHLMQIWVWGWNVFARKCEQLLEPNMIQKETFMISQVMIPNSWTKAQSGSPPRSEGRKSRAIISTSFWASDKLRASNTNLQRAYTPKGLLMRDIQPQRQTWQQESLWGRYHK